MPIRFFDCNIQIGNWSAPKDEQPRTAQDIAALMAEAGIAEGLAFHALAKEYSPAEGNERLMREIQGLPLHPCWVLMPHHTGEMAAPGDLIQEMRERGVKAAKLYPVAHQYRLSEWCAGKLLSALEENRVPVLVDFDQINFDEVALYLSAHPHLRLILLRTSYRCDRYLYPLMEKYEHLCVEIGGYQVAGGVEAIAKRFGARRLIFGSGMPVFSPGPPIAQVMYADVPDPDKEIMAGGALRELILW